MKTEELLDQLTPEQQVEHRSGMLSFSFLSEIEKEMDRQGINRSDLAALLGTSKSYLTQLWRGDKYVNVTLIARMEAALNIHFKIKTIKNAKNVQKEAGGVTGHSVKGRQHLRSVPFCSPQ